MFAPLLRLISRLSVGRKLMLIYLLDLSAVIFVSGILVNEKFIAIDFARKEIVGNAYIASVRDAFVAAGGTLASVPSASESKTLATAVERTEQNLGAELGSSDVASAFAGALVALADENLSTKTSGSALARGRALITRVGNQSNLILDPDLDSYYTMSLIVLRFPELVELLDLTARQAKATASLPAATRGEALTQYLILEGRLDAIVNGSESDYAEALAAGDKALTTRLTPTRTSLREALEAFRQSSRAIIETGPEQAQSLMVTHAAALQAAAAAWGAAQTAMDGLLAARVSHLYERMWTHLGAALVLLMLILSVVFFVARQIALPLRKLSDVATRVRETGDYSLRAERRDEDTASSDEIGRLLKAFNGMLEQLDQLRLVEQELAASARAAATQREMVEAIPIPLVVTAIPYHEVLHANGPAQVWLGNCDKNPWQMMLEPHARTGFFQRLADIGEVREFEARWQRPGEAPSWALLAARRLVYQGRDAVLATFTPINRIKQMERRLAMWARVFEASSESILVTNAEGFIIDVNRAFSRTSAFDPSELADLPASSVLASKRSDAAFFSEIWRLAAIQGSWQGEAWLGRKSGESFPVWLLVNAVRDGDGQITHFIAAARDISERKSNEERIQHLAHHDPLTDLPNRALCIERLRLAMQQAQRSGQKIAVLFIDLDRFKNINDSLGHHIGDALLRSVARRLIDGVRAADTVSRLGGDEFVIILNGFEHTDEVMEIVYQRLIPRIRQPHDIDGAELFVSCSVGIAVYPDDAEEIDLLMRNADAAMYLAKTSGRNNAQFFTPELSIQASERLSIENELRHAIEREELCLYYQPRIATRSQKLVGIEALVRWQHPEKGLLSPIRFIPVAEESGLIIPLGNWILREACRQHIEWRGRGIGSIPVSVNLSALQLRDPGLLAMIDSTLRDTGMEASMLELELTESLLMEDVSKTIELLAAIRERGLKLSIDDFGTGYSSLNYLRRFPIDALKIDQSFIRGMLDDAQHLAITKAIIGIGQTLGLRVVAEGVEQEEELRVLTAAGCDEIQGYYFSRPLPAAEMAAWIANYGTKD
ncbi:EAL domain-containing protein [Rhodocyclus tenuis]|uniref:bifunctional diguanylate cyclase/phosphodiesterase n=1 Tax=Rhodocyclus tenuis TaxID=1066 RepID=UPI0019055648|nr:EAL domain-containing protein [Rhodocyclus tenuis]MBK1679326.1 sensor domain-containing diguanylate cyclase [Rhodocyclus tenuis]